MLVIQALVFVRRGHPRTSLQDDTMNIVTIIIILLLVVKHPSDFSMELWILFFGPAPRNRLGETIPAELGRLSSLKALVLASNYLEAWFWNGKLYLLVIRLSVALSWAAVSCFRRI